MEAHGQLTLSPNMLCPETKENAQRLFFSVMCIVLTDARICKQLLQLSAQSLIGSPSTAWSVEDDTRNAEFNGNRKFDLVP